MKVSNDSGSLNLGTFNGGCPPLSFSSIGNKTFFSSSSSSSSLASLFRFFPSSSTSFSLAFSTSSHSNLQFSTLSSPSPTFASIIFLTSFKRSLTSSATFANVFPPPTSPASNVPTSSSFITLFNTRSTYFAPTSSFFTRARAYLTHIRQYAKITKPSPSRHLSSASFQSPVWSSSQTKSFACCSLTSFGARSDATASSS